MSFRTAVAVGIVIVVGLAAAPSISAALQFRYAAFGDSLAAGLWALPGQGYVPRYMRYAESDTGVNLQLIPLGIPGWTSSELRNALQGSAVFRLAAFSSELITFNVGGNDLRGPRSLYKTGACGTSDNQQCLRDAVTSFRTNWDAIVSEIRHLRRGRPTVIRTMDIYNPYVAQDISADTWPGDAGSDFVVLNSYLDAANAHIVASAVSNGILVAPVHAAFNGSSGAEDPVTKGYISFDGLHPNALGHRVIADQLRGLLYAATVP